MTLYETYRTGPRDRRIHQLTMQDTVNPGEIEAHVDIMKVSEKSYVMEKDSFN